MTPVLNVKLAEEDWHRVLTYLSEFPFKNVANLMAEIQKQLMAQVETPHIQRSNGELHDRPGVQ